MAIAARPQLLELVACIAIRRVVVERDFEPFDGPIEVVGRGVVARFLQIDARGFEQSSLVSYSVFDVFGLLGERSLVLRS